MHWTKQFREDRELQRQGQVRLEHGFSYLGFKSHRRWSAVTFNPRADANYELRGLSIVQYRPDSSEEFRLEASRGLWLDGYWWFENVKTRYFDRNNRPIGRVEPAAQLDLTSLSETPQDFIDETKDPETERSAADIFAAAEQSVPAPSSDPPAVSPTRSRKRPPDIRRTFRGYQQRQPSTSIKRIA